MPAKPQPKPEMVDRFGAGWLHVLPQARPRSATGQEIASFSLALGGWEVAGWFSVIDGQGVMSEMTIRPSSAKVPLPGITSSLLRAIHTGGLVSAIQTVLDRAATEAEFGQTLKQLEKAAKRAAPRTGKERGGRPRYSDDHYRRIALAYLKLQSGGQRGILRIIGDKEGVQPETVRDWLARAEELGFLTSGSRGRADRRPGPKLYTIDQQED